MRIPKQISPVIRDASARQPAGTPGVVPADCTGIPTSIIGTCFFDDSGPVNGFNCPACCAMRHATGWTGGGHVVAC